MERIQTINKTKILILEAFDETGGVEENRINLSYAEKNGINSNATSFLVSSDLKSSGIDIVGANELKYNQVTYADPS